MVATQTLIWFFVTLFMMGFFAGIEMAFYSANRLGIELKKKQGKPGAVILSGFIEKPELFLGITLIGFTLFLVWFVQLFGMVTGPMWALVGLGAEKFDLLRLILDIILCTFVVLIFAEFIPRAIFRSRSNFVLSRLVWLINIFYRLLQPIAALLISLSDWVLKYVFNIRMKEKKEVLGRASLETLFQQNNENDEPQELDTEMFDNALNLGKVKTREFLIPRKEVVGVDITCSIEETKKKFIETKLSKLVVFENNIDNITGYIHQLDLFKNPVNLQAILLPISAVPESMSATDLINKLTKERKSMAWVVDEFGGTSGIVTMEDVLEELFGEIHDEYDSEEFVEKRLSEDEYMFAGRLELDYLEKKYELAFNDDESETLSGYIISHHETIPKQKTRIIIDDYEFDILNVSDTRIEMVKLRILK